MTKRVLIIKTSSMGDVLHTLPALTDASLHIPGIKFDWLVEEAFQEIPTWHPAVNEVIPVAIRRLRKSGISGFFSKEWRAFKQQMKARRYDAIIDAQGLMKSALLVRLAQGPSFGLAKDSAREPMASWFYQHKISVPKAQHAVERTRQLFANSLGYSLEQSSNKAGDYGIRERLLVRTKQDNWSNKAYLVFLHGTTWETKHYPESYWQELIKLAADENLNVHLVHGNQQELARAKRLASHYRHVTVHPKLSLKAVASLLCHAKAAIAVDTGLGHLAAAVDCPTLSLFGPTNAKLTGAYGTKQKHLSSSFSCSPCLKKQCPVTSGEQAIPEYNAEQIKQIAITPPCFSTLDPQITWLNFKLLLENS